MLSTNPFHLRPGLLSFMKYICVIVFTWSIYLNELKATIETTGDSGNKIVFLQEFSKWKFINISLNIKQKYQKYGKLFLYWHTFHCHLLHPALIHPAADEQYHFHFLCRSVHCLSHLTGLRLKGAGQVEVFRVSVSHDVFIGLSRCLPSASVLLWWPSCSGGQG